MHVRAPCKSRNIYGNRDRDKDIDIDISFFIKQKVWPCVHIYFKFPFSYFKSIANNKRKIQSYVSQSVVNNTVSSYNRRNFQ
jgi:hypothetical protein